MVLQCMLNLQVTIDPNSGFCFGVVYAIEMAEDILDSNERLYCLGDIVHNDEEVKRLQNKGLVIINHEDLKDLRDQKVLIRAHGEPPSTYQLAIQNNLELIDASCPVVLKLQNRIKNSYDKKEQILIYGKHDMRRLWVYWGKPIMKLLYSRIWTSLKLKTYLKKLLYTVRPQRALPIFTA